MALSTVPVLSEPKKLADVSKAVRKREGSCPSEERAWISVRQATEQDSMMLEDSVPDTQLEYVDAVGDDGRVRRKMIERRDDRFRNRVAMQVYMTITGAGNITGGDGKPLFRFRDAGDYHKFDGNFEEFLGAYGQLPSIVTEAMRDIVFDHNPQWDWRSRRTEGEVDEEAESPASSDI